MIILIVFLVLILVMQFIYFKKEIDGIKKRMTPLEHGANTEDNRKISLKDIEKKISLCMKVIKKRFNG